MASQFTTAGFRTEFVSEDVRRALSWARRRQVLDKARFDALSFQNKLQSWTVAGDLSQRSIMTIQKSVFSAIERGENIADWRKTLTPEVYDNITVPKTVYRNAVNQVYQKGRFDQQTRIKELRPYLQYVTFGDENVRPNHAVLNGYVAKQGDGFWLINYPPNGHNCRCVARALSDANIKRQGLTSMNQAQIERDIRKKQLAQGVPESKIIEGKPDKGWEGSFTEGSFGAQKLIEVFGKPPTRFFSAITPRPATIISREASKAKKAEQFTFTGTTQSQKIKSIEGQIIDRPTEYAAVIDSNGQPMTFSSQGTTVKKGKKRSVTFTNEEIETMQKLDGAVLTHGHPDDDSFSPQDFLFWARAKLKEMRAVGIRRDGRRFLFRLTRSARTTDANIQALQFQGKGIWSRMNRNQKRLWNGRLRKGEITAKYYNDNFYDTLNKDFSDLFNLKYTREAI